MPPKRTGSSSSSTSPTWLKRQKTGTESPGQLRLDAFFGGRALISPSKWNREHDRVQTPATDHEEANSPSRVVIDLTLSDSESENVNDALYAANLARQEGIALETVRRLEDGWSQANGKPSSTVPVESRNGTTNLQITEGSNGQPEGSSSDVGAQSQPERRLWSGLKLEAGSLTFLPPEYTLGEDPLTFRFDDCPWPQEFRPAPYSFIAHALSSLAETRSRIVILNILTNTLRALLQFHLASLLPAIYLLSNSLSPPYSPVELGLGPSVIQKAIQHVSGISSAALHRLYTISGDPGDVAFEAKSNVRTLIPHPPLTVMGVYDSLQKIARLKGIGATKHKQSLVEKILVAAKGEESRFLVRTLCQNLRVGAVRTSLLTALARAMAISSNDLAGEQAAYVLGEDLLSRIVPAIAGSQKKPLPDESRTAAMEKLSAAEKLVKTVYVRHPNFDHIVPALLKDGFKNLSERVPLCVGIPLHPTLGTPTRSLDQVYDTLKGLLFTAELKYDGQRAQIHAQRSLDSTMDIYIYSRHLEDMTEKYPDVVSLMRHILQSGNHTSFIMDAEIVAINPDGTLRSFQELSNRARKDVSLHEVKVSVCVFAFDLMYLDSQVLLAEPLRRRRHLLRSEFQSVILQDGQAARFALVESCESEAGRAAVEKFWQGAVQGRAEGLMIKLLDNGENIQDIDTPKGKTRRKLTPLATYEPDKRTAAWLKLKKDYVTGLGDSIDAVPIGAYHGNGRKAQWWSPILLGLWDGEQFVAVCKCMSGFTDAHYKEIRASYNEESGTCSPTPIWGGNFGAFRPDVFFQPKEVWEIRGADITVSPVSTAALGLASATRGLSLRFPRFIKIRDDKGLDQASSPTFFAELYKIQESKGENPGGADDGELFDADIDDDDKDENEI